MKFKETSWIDFFGGYILERCSRWSAAYNDLSNEHLGKYMLWTKWHFLIYSKFKTLKAFYGRNNLKVLWQKKNYITTENRGLCLIFYHCSYTFLSLFWLFNRSIQKIFFDTIALNAWSLEKINFHRFLYTSIMFIFLLYN